MRAKGTGKWQLQIIECLHGTKNRYTVAALRMTVNSSYNVLEKSLNGLLEIGAIKADPWKSGYCYRAPHIETSADVVEVRLRPQIVITKP